MSLSGLNPSVYGGHSQVQQFKGWFLFATQLQVCINGALFSRYEHRLNPERVTTISVNGALTLKSVLHYINGTQVDVPQSAFKTCFPLGTSASLRNVSTHN
jgi:hypothetical protein